MSITTLVVMIIVNIIGIIVAYRAKKQFNLIMYNPVVRDVAIKGALKTVRYVMAGTVIVCVVTIYMQLSK